MMAKEPLIKFYFRQYSVSTPQENIAKLKRFRDFPFGALPCLDKNILLIRGSLRKFKYNAGEFTFTHIRKPFIDLVKWSYLPNHGIEIE